MKQECEVRHIGSVAVLDLFGKVTVGNGAVQLRQAVDEQLDRGVRYLLVNLTGVRYMDAAGIGELVACHNRVQARQGLIRLISPSGRVLAGIEEGEGVVVRDLTIEGVEAWRSIGSYLEDRKDHLDLYRKQLDI